MRNSSGLVRAAELGFKTGGLNYDSGRPSYTPATVDTIARLVSDVMTSESDNSRLKYSVVELGAGTGKMTQVLYPKLPSSCPYLACEPSEDFLNVLTSKQLGVKTHLGSAASIPSSDTSVGCVVCAQSFHWFADEQHLKEIRRVLVPGGKLVIAMNWKQFDHDWMQPIYDQRQRVYAQTGSSMKYLINSFAWQADLNTSKFFSLADHVSLPGVEFRGDLDKILANLTTVSAYNMLTEDERNGYLEELQAVLKTWPGVDVSDMSVPYSSEIYVYTAV